MIIRAGKIERRIEQSCLLQSKKYGIGALCSAEATSAQSLVGLAGIFFFIGQANFEPSLAAALKNAQDISRLRNLPTRNRIKQAEKTFDSSLCFRARLQQCLRCARFAVTFSVARIFQRETAVVIERGAPEHRAVRHHAARDVLRLRFMTPGGRARFPNYTQISRVHEAHKFPTLALPLACK